MSEIIEHEGVKYRKVVRDAKVGEKVIVTKPIRVYPLVEVGGVYQVLPVGVTEGGIGIAVDRSVDEDGEIHIYHEEYAVLEPLADASTTPNLPKLTDAKPGETVRIVDVKDYTDEGYRAGDTFEVTSVWGNRGGVYTVDGPSLYAEEFEVVRAPIDLAQSLEEAAQLAEQYEKPAGETQADSVRQPAHYTQGGVEVIEYIEQVTAGYSDGFVAHCVGTVIKYVSRAPHKHATPTEDLRKAREYLNFAIARLES